MLRGDSKKSSQTQNSNPTTTACMEMRTEPGNDVGAGQLGGDTAMEVGIIAERIVNASWPILPLEVNVESHVAGGDEESIHEKRQSGKQGYYAFTVVSLRYMQGSAGTYM